MGYQESLIHVKEENFQQLLDLVNKMGRDYFRFKGVEIFAEIVLNKNIRYDYLTGARGKIFKKGEKLLWVGGERTDQRNISRLFGRFYSELPEETNIYFIENFDNCNKVFNIKDGTPYLTETALEIPESSKEIKQKLQL